MISARLINWTPEPLTTLWYLWNLCHDPGIVPPASHVDVSGARVLSDHLQGYPVERKDIVAFFKKLVLFEPNSPIPEFIVFNWYIEGPRALLAQITRHRHLSFYAQSQRQHARDDDYFIPEKCINLPELNWRYRQAMSKSFRSYDYLVKAGAPRQEARGVLPMHSMTGFVMSSNLRSLVDLALKRSCWLAQGDYWGPLLLRMREELVTRVDTALACIFQSYCEVRGHCMSPLENQIRADGRSPLPVCPKYVQKGEESPVCTGCGPQRPLPGFNAS